MSKTETKTVQTPHGDIEYDVVECDSCGNETTPEKAKDFTIGDRVGKACPYCYEEGPIDFPGKQAKQIICRDGDFAFGVLCWPIVAFGTTIKAYSDWQRGYALASLGAFLWMCAVVVFLFAVL